MSYIRSLSNPERLYIWEGKNSIVTIAGGISAGRYSINSHSYQSFLDKNKIAYTGSELLTIPVSTFEGWGEKWKKTIWEKKCSFRDLEGEERIDLQHRWRLRYPSWDRDLVMYTVTLHYIFGRI